MYTCLHCDESAVNPIFQKEDERHERPFCCEGCLTVYQVIHLKGLDSYYAIKKDSALIKRRAPVEKKSSNFTYLNDPDFLKEFSWSVEDKNIMEFYLEGIHCLACLWLIEKLPEFVPGIYSSKLDLDRSVVTVTLNNGARFSEAASELSNLGYNPHPLKKNQSTNDLKKSEDRKWLMRIGLSGAAAGNIMLYAVSLYGGASGEYDYLFNAISVVFAIPVFTFCAVPFYQNAWHALKNKTLSIDIPISLSLIVGAFMGLYNLFTGVPDNYFDSLSALVFLLLLSRYFLHRIQERGLSASDLHYFYQSESILVKDESFADGFREVHPRYIKNGDVLKIRPGEILPADGTVLEGTSHINSSLLTGESFPVKVSEGNRVFSGTQNLDNELLVWVEKTASDSRLGSILKNVENGWSHRSKIIQLTNVISKYFTLTVILLTCVLFIYLFQKHDLKAALEGAITLMIVTCPCALALAVPLTFSRSLSRAAEKGIIIKSDEVIERLSQVQSVFIDKTGTITFGRLKVIKLEMVKPGSIPLNDIIYNLEKRSVHPVAIALLDHVKTGNNQDYQVENYKEILGAGVSGVIDGHLYEINRDGIFEENKLIARFTVNDVIREDSKQSLKDMMNFGVQVKLLTGDKRDVALKIARQAQIDSSFVLSDLSPEDKSQLIRSSKNSLMIGDGANDAIALSEASVGVAVLGAMDISLRAADVYLSTPGLSPVVKLMTLSRETMRVIRRNLVLSLLYNSISVVCAFTGVITPLVAAIIMPLSSLTVLISTLVGTKQLRSLWKS